jgi:hypothetical protein
VTDENCALRRSYPNGGSYTGSVTLLIESGLPGTWQDLEAQVAQILDECGYEVEMHKDVHLARGDVNIDVWADDHGSPPNVFAVECKCWATLVPKNVVHGFRTVVGDSGANTGLIVSSRGFQAGAVDAAAYSNVQLTTWAEFQRMFASRWFNRYMSPMLAKETEALHEYTERINTRVFRKADELPEDRRDQFKALRQRHLPLAILNLMLHPIAVECLVSSGALPLPDLPLRNATDLGELEDRVPEDVLDATALRPLMTSLIEHSRRAIAEFDEVFGQRA